MCTHEYVKYKNVILNAHTCACETVITPFLLVEDISAVHTTTQRIHLRYCQIFLLSFTWQRAFDTETEVSKSSGCASPVFFALSDIKSLLLQNAR